MKVDLNRLGQHTNWLERAAVNRTRPELIQGGKVFRCAIAFVLGEIVLRILRVELHHEPIARHFRKHTGGGNRIALRVTADDCLLGIRNRFDR